MSRFTLDSATEFLFGSCVHSLHAGLPYPHNAVPPVSSSEIPKSNTANDFAGAFLQAQYIIAERERLGWVWPLFEFFEDRTRGPMKVVNAYLEPIIKEAIAKKAAFALEEKQAEDVSEDETVLDHLVKLTSGELLLSHVLKCLSIFHS